MKMDTQFKLTITANLSDGSEINDIEATDAVSAEDIGETAWALARVAAGSHAIDIGKVAQITSLVIVAVPA
jgi:hypothetical protein